MHLWRGQRTSSVAPQNPSGRTTHVAEALVAVRDAVQLYGHEPLDFGPIRTSVRVLCGIARRDDIPPEQLVIELKHTLAGLPEFDALTSDVPTPMREEIRSRVVSCAIQSYFSETR